MAVPQTVSDATANNNDITSVVATLASRQNGRARSRPMTGPQRAAILMLALGEQHGGKVDLVDAEPDENGRVGAAFTFTLPLRRAGEGEGDASPSPDARGAEQQAAPAASDGAAGGAEQEGGQQGEPQLRAVENS